MTGSKRQGGIVAQVVGQSRIDDFEDHLEELPNDAKVL